MSQQAPRPAPGAGDGHEALAAQVRGEDPDRWLATRLITAPTARREIVALYAFYGEIRGVARRARQPLAGELRLAWWLDAVQRVSRGAAADHPALEALAPALREGRLPLGPLERMIEARRLTLDPASTTDDAERVAALDDSAGALMEAAAVVLGRPGEAAPTLRQAGRAWGWSGLARRTEDGELADHARERSRVALELARGEVEALVVAAFPAVAYLVFIDDRLAGRRRGELGRRLRLLWAAARGRV